MPDSQTEFYTIESHLLANFDRYLFPKSFDCGVEVINGYFRNGLKRSLRSENVSGLAAVSSAGSVLGFCTLALCSLDRQQVASALAQANLPPQVAAVRLVMLGVDKAYQGQGIGRQLLRKLFLQAIRVHSEIPIKGIYLDAAPDAVSFYLLLGFDALDDADTHGSTPMFLPIRALLRAM